MARLLLLGTLVLALVVPTVAAQTSSQDQVVLQMEISKNGSLIAGGIDGRPVSAYSRSNVWESVAFASSVTRRIAHNG